MPSGLSVDVANEFDAIRAEADLLARALPSFLSEGTDMARRRIEIAGVAATVETIYTGCERIMSMLAKSVDGDAVASGDGWHATLINRMANPYPDVRSAIISEECRWELDRFRSFRHRVRNSYGMVLDEVIVLDRAREVAIALDLFHADVTAFLTRRDDG